MNKFRVLLLLAIASFATAESGDLPSSCGVLKNHYGPYDYRDLEVTENLHLVEQYHFTAPVESLSGGQSGYIPQDLDYTLRVFPNHHRALNSMGRYDLRGMGKGKHGPLVLTAECYFQRGIAWRPDDETVRMIYGNYLFQKGDKEAARSQYQVSLQIAPGSPEVNYNYGLLLLDLGELQQAAKHASVAYAGGYPLPGLRRRLESAGVRIESAITP